MLYATTQQPEFLGAAALHGIELQGSMLSDLARKSVPGESVEVFLAGGLGQRVLYQATY
jgi:hypothetical protein